MRLATFVHISDLHFGDVDLNGPNHDAVPPGIVAAMASNFGPVWDGLLGHSEYSLMRLEQAFAKLHKEEEARLIVTGDLTAYGSIDQFDMAAAFIGDMLRPPKVSSPIGLRQKGWKMYGVPGNHDHWSGHPRIFGGPTAGLATHFPSLPTLTQTPLGPPGPTLVFLRVDSDSDVGPHSPNRFFARGSFAKSLAALSGQLGPLSSNQIRVLLIHHSYSLTGRQLVMTPHSKASLNDFIVEHGIRVILSGHVHQPPFISTLTASHLMRTRTFLEARSGTTTQISTLPLYWRSFIHRRPQRPGHWPNSFLVHRIMDNGGRLTWESETYLEDEYGFKATPMLPGGLSGTGSIQVLP